MMDEGKPFGELTLITRCSTSHLQGAAPRHFYFASFPPHCRSSLPGCCFCPCLRYKCRCLKSSAVLRRKECT
ncbi:hypothetical protein Y1Q_0023855 [Alligator mississippiensis]|uniref:Uncharacterized protein n=1 Tax=Alligator mississippiensis TaxID=8496 RepID=A0A151MKW3_ALLMI|nr:hypothetical protein Y1Q_0023855 [Alligator mississippiensis]